jgi:hypothetical protein
MFRPAYRAFYCAAVLVALLPSSGVAQSLCSLPVSAYLTDAAGAPLDGTLDVELEFYLDAAPDSTPSECRSFAAMPVDAGWLRVDVDACSAPDPDDCGTMPLSEILRGASGLWVAVVVDETELGPRIPVGAVPYAVEASNAALLQGLEPDAFEAAGSIDGHAAGAEVHHSSTSDGIAITPASVEIGDTRIESGSVDLGPDATDTLTAEIVQTLTSGGEADALHTHGGSHESGGACYQVIGSTDCAEGFVLVSQGSIVALSNNPVCMDTSNLTPFSGDTGCNLSNVGCTPSYWSLDVPDVECATCCGWPIEGP